MRVRRWGRSGRGEGGVGRRGGTGSGWQNCLCCVLNSRGFAQRIQYLLSRAIAKMSYMTVLPNSYFNPCNSFPAFPNPYLNTQPLSSTKNILNFLKSALTISLNNYQLNYQQPSSMTPQCPAQPVSPTLTQQSPQNSLELIQPPQENKEIPTVLPVAAEPASPCKATPLDLKEGKREPQTLTDDEFLLEDKEKSLKKNQVSRRKGKKVKEDPLNNFVVAVPDTDLLETAYLPALSLAFADICRKREEILKRQVGSWSEQGRSKKDKREIRMLCN